MVAMIGMTMVLGQSVGPRLPMGGGGVAALVNTVLPAIPGTAQEGQGLTATTGTWTGSPTGYAWQWRRGGSPIAAATSAVYVPVPDDVGETLTVTVTASKAGTASVAATSSATAAVTAAPVAPRVTAIAADGWQATYPSPPTFDPVGDPVTLAVTRTGFDGAGAATTLGEAITLMKRVRQPYPNQATLTADQVALSDFVYAGDTLPAGVTNNSALDYPQPVAMWLTPDLERERTGTFTARLAVAHAYARNGRPVAAVKFIATDGTNTVEQTVNTLSSRQWASGLWSDYFECGINLSTLNPATLCTLDVIIYPWVGEAFQASVHGSPYPGPNFTVLKFLNDRTGSYGEAFAYVDPAASGGAVSAVAATAATTPFRTLALAASAIQAFNNTTYGRNQVAGGTVRLVAGTHTHGTFAATIAGDIPLLVEGMGATRDDTIYQDPGSTPANNTRLPSKLKMRNLTIRKVGDNITMLDNNATLSYPQFILIFDNVRMDQNGTSQRAAYLHRTGRFFTVDSALATLAFSAQANVAKFGNAVGCTGAVNGNGIYSMVACTASGGPNARPAVGQLPAAAGQLVQNCFLSQPTDGSKVIEIAAANLGPRGFAVVGTVAEHFGGTTGPAVTIYADTNANTVQNMVFIGNTVVGSRMNWLYQDTGTATVSKRGFLRGSVSLMHNTKTDVFAANANLVGNWSETFHVGNRDCAWLEGSSSADDHSVGSWLGEVQPLNTVSGTNAAPLVAAWADDRSFSGAATGGGDYTPGAGSALPFIPAGLAACSIDQKGRAVADNGSARAGALQPA